MSDYLKRIREVGNFAHYSPLPPTFMGFPAYPDYDDVNNFYLPYPAVYPAYGGPVFREKPPLSTEFPPSEEVTENKDHPIAFRYAGMKQLNYSVNTPDSLHLIDVDYENDVYFLHNKAILRVNLGENEAQFDTIAVIDDTHEEIREAHVS